MSVDYYTLGSSGLRVSRLALGTVTFGTDWGWGADENASRAIFQGYLELGGNFIDTADNYTGGTSEQMVGKFIREAAVRDQVVLASKYSFGSGLPNPNMGGNHRKNMLRAVEASLRRLATDYLDLYWMHAWDRLTPLEEMMRSFDDLVRSGKVRYIGLSNIPGWVAARAQTIAELRGWEKAAAMQLEYSLVERNIEREHTPLAQQLGMGIVAWSPLGSGLLSGRYRPSRDGVEGQGRLAFLKGNANPAFLKFTDRNFAIVSELERVASEVGRSMSQVALNWLAHRPGVAALVFGATKLDQLRDNMAALQFGLDASLSERLDAVSRPISLYPYSFAEDEIQGLLHDGAQVGDKPEGYFSPVRIAGTGARVD